MASPFASPRLLWLAGFGALVAALVATNPGPGEFEAYAATQLVDMAAEELCGSEALPLVARLVVDNCTSLVRSQRQTLGGLARQGSRRLNVGLASLYITELGGQRILPQFTVPRYRAVTLAGAGQFLLLQATTDNGGSPR